MTTLLPPPFTPLAQADTTLRAQGYAVLAPDDLCRDTGAAAAALTAWSPAWERLPSDHFLRDGGSYRRRRHSCFVLEAGRCTPAPHRAHWQPLAYNALHGGFERLFEPFEPSVVQTPAWTALLLALAQHASALRGAQPWFVEAHAFRIDTASGIGRPTPEGAHRDGVDLVAVLLLQRRGVKGGETRIFDALGPQGLRFTLTEPLSCVLLDDERVIHETTPIQPLDAAQPGVRDTLVLTFRAGGFQSA